MPEVDLTVTISVIIALCAILSPIFTAIINNCHDTKLKKLEYEHLEREEERKHERELYEGYIRAAGSCIQYQGKEQKTNFGEHSSLLAYAVPDEEIRKRLTAYKLGLLKMTKLTKAIKLFVQETYQKYKAEGE